MNDNIRSKYNDKNKILFTKTKNIYKIKMQRQKCKYILHF